MKTSRREFAALTVGLTGLILLIRQPLATGYVRLGEAACTALAIAAIGALARRRHWSRKLAIACALALIGFLVWPTSPRVTSEQERRAIVAAAEAYRGAPYAWGGESVRGIDCSGLIRRAYADAALQLAWRHASPRHLRRALYFWAFDASARDFEGQRPVHGVRIAAPGEWGRFSKGTFRAGDCAVMGNGTHVLLYLGDERWIQADPLTHTVHITDQRTDSWFGGAGVVLRPRFVVEADTEG